MQIDFLGIQAFLAVAECGSFHLAAERLNLSQTAISHRMRKLEDALGAPLLVRTSRGVALTEAGSALLPQARASVQQLSVSCEMVRRHGQQASRWIAFACLPTLATAVIVPLLARHGERDARSQVRVYDSSPAEIVDLVAAGTAAFGLTVQRTPVRDLDVEPIAREPFVLACPSAHPLAGRARVSWDELVDEPLIRISLPSGNSMTIDDALGPLGERLRWRYEAQRNAMALDMVRAGLGLTVVPRLSVLGVTGIAAVAIDGPAVWRSLVLVRRSDRIASPAESWMSGEAVGMVRALLAGP